MTVPFTSKERERERETVKERIKSVSERMGALREKETSAAQDDRPLSMSAAVCCLTVQKVRVEEERGEK